MPLDRADAGRAPDGKPTITFYDRAGRKIRTHVGGSRAARNNNPGNLQWNGRAKGSFAERHGAIGSDGIFAIFPDVETGREARRRLLEGPTYRDRTINDAIENYDKKSPPEKREEYKRNVADWTGLDGNRTIGNLSPEEQNSLFRAMERQEGFLDKDGNILNPSMVIEHAKGGTNATNPMERPIETWSEDDVRAVMASEAYQRSGAPGHDEAQENVRAWFEHFFGDGPDRRDAVGRPVDPAPIRPIPTGGGPVRVRAHAREGGKVAVDAYNRAPPSR